MMRGTPHRVPFSFEVVAPHPAVSTATFSPWEKGSAVSLIDTAAKIALPQSKR